MQINLLLSRPLFDSEGKQLFLKTCLSHFKLIMIAELISIQANLGDVIDKAIIKDGYNFVVVN
jgi:hypothetical protein